MFPCTSNFSRDVEINENDEKELTLRFDLKDYKVRLYKLKSKGTYAINTISSYFFKIL